MLSDHDHERNWLIFQDDKSWFTPKAHTFNLKWAIGWGLAVPHTAMFKRIRVKNGWKYTDELMPEWKKMYDGRHGPLLKMGTYLRMLNNLGAGTWEEKLVVPAKWRAKLAEREEGRSPCEDEQAVKYL